MLFDHDESASAIYFFDGKGQMLQEMHYSEFEAILDGYVPAAEWADRTLNAAYVHINSEFCVVGVAFFTVTFLKNGEIDGAWNLPLESLVINAKKGPDMGAGPIRLACASQCPISHFKSALCDPSVKRGANQFHVIRRAASANKLGISFRPPSEESIAERTNQQALKHQEEQNQQTQQYMQEMRAQMAQLIKDQRLREDMLDNERQAEVDALKKEFTNRVEEYRQIVSSQAKTIEEEQQRNNELKDTIDGQAEKISGLREYFEHKLAQKDGEESDQLSKLKENYEVELAAKIEAATTELKQLLQMRDVELLYRNEKEAQLQEEIANLRVENEAYIESSGDKLLDQMAAKSVSFVTFQPGAGHLTIPKSEMSKYMENPVAYAAKSCGVSEGHYLAWLEHYQAPVCVHPNDDGHMCSANIDRVAQPIDFKADIDDRCRKHQKLAKANPLKLA